MRPPSPTPSVLPLRERGPIEHELKTWPEPYAAVKSGAKPFEYRRNDRDYRVGDTLLLREWTPSWTPGEGSYTGDELRRVITFILAERLFGVPKGFCVMGLIPSVPPALPEGGGEIDSAPKDGRDILLWNGLKWMVGWWVRYAGSTGGGYWHPRILPTRWQPLPPPPISSAPSVGEQDLTRSQGLVDQPCGDAGDPARAAPEREP